MVKKLSLAYEILGHDAIDISAVLSRAVGIDESDDWLR
jgi:hypothetical protein